jgi:prephenate dehydratase
MAVALTSETTIAYLGPRGTFSEEALRSQEDLADCHLVAMSTIADAIRACATGAVDFAFVPIENSIEGSVSMTVDELIFGEELFIQREVIIDIHLDLLARSDVGVEQLHEVISHPHALAQARRFFQRELPNVVTSVTNSTAEAARLVSESDRDDIAALAPPITASIYGLHALSRAVEDQLGNETRFVLIAPSRVPAPSGNDRTALVCFQRSDHPGGLHQLLGIFASRSINLVRLESRPTKLGLGDYCFVIELQGHISEPEVADAIKELYGELASLRFLGSYPLSRPDPLEHVAERETEHLSAAAWLAALLARVEE